MKQFSTLYLNNSTLQRQSINLWIPCMSKCRKLDIPITSRSPDTRQLDLLSNKKKESPPLCKHKRRRLTVFRLKVVCIYLALPLGGARLPASPPCSLTLLVHETGRRFRNVVTHQAGVPHAANQLHGTVTRVYRRPLNPLLLPF